MLAFYPYLFDSREAWEKTISDVNYRYDMPLSEFMKIYGSYRNNSNPEIKTSQIYTTTYDLPKFNKTQKKEIYPNCEEILNQTEIDELLKSFS